jgi:hypothetical protein
MKFFVMLRRETYMINMEKKDWEMAHKHRDFLTSSTCSGWAGVKEEDKSRRRELSHLEKYLKWPLKISSVGKKKNLKLSAREFALNAMD